MSICSKHTTSVHLVTACAVGQTYSLYQSMNSTGAADNLQRQQTQPQPCSDRNLNVSDASNCTSTLQYVWFTIRDSIIQSRKATSTRLCARHVSAVHAVSHRRMSPPNNIAGFSFQQQTCADKQQSVSPLKYLRRAGLVWACCQRLGRPA